MNETGPREMGGPISTKNDDQKLWSTPEKHNFFVFGGILGTFHFLVKGEKIFGRVAKGQIFTCHWGGGKKIWTANWLGFLRGSISMLLKAKMRQFPLFPILPTHK